MAADAMLEQVRRFNRVVTERVGALDDRFLGHAMPLGEARVLWEIGADGCELRLLRARLGLDSGYLSRLLRSLEASRLVKVAAGQDRRVRVARLTAAGRRERAKLDEHSDQRASWLLEPLTGAQRERLVAAMADVERLLTAASVEILPVDPEDPDARYCLAEYAADLNARSTSPERRFDPQTGATAHPHEVRPPAGQFFVAYLHGEPIGCGAVKHHADAPAELKRMWIAPRARGLGQGRRLLETLEQCAREGGAPVGHIETSAVSTEALAMYRSAGWVEVEQFNDEPFADHWLEKRLA
ncbi:MAG TPA: bifunctional helix-turn-helix transcriptional regulator/GNAT family N-acetyltransferase [Solirubrobacteraceae bacterium]|nr:bifunctional helix-turn-helix transcriptional regulator/GNAT family N-acetyltransferase [Solirubrobacteraceae bacterium]